MSETPQMLPGMEAIQRTLGANETSLKQTIERYLQEEALDPVKDAALIALAYSAAEALDNTSADEKASGKSSLIKTYLSVLEAVHDRAAAKSAMATINNIQEAAPHMRALSVING